MYTPWGKAQDSKEMAPGITAVFTAGHGGIKLSDERWAQFQKAYPTFRPFAGPRWLEEDCDMLLIYFLWADEFGNPKSYNDGTLQKYLGYCKNFNNNGDKPYFPLDDIKREMEKTIKRIENL